MQCIDGKPPVKSIALTRYPRTRESARDQASLEEMDLLQNLIVEVRALRKEIGMEEKAQVPIEVRSHAAASGNCLRRITTLLGSSRA